MKKLLNIEPLSQTPCDNCALRFTCFPSCIDRSELPELNLAIEKNFIVTKGSAIFTQNAPSPHLYVIKSGAVKSTVSFNNQEQITGFYLAGDIIGIESIGHEKYINNAYALQKTTLCSISVEELNKLFKKNYKLCLYCLNLSVNRLRKNQRNLIFSQFEAKKRVSIFLLSLISYYQEHKLSFKTIQLPMPKSDISNYLGLTPETLSRTFTQLKEDKIITIEGRNISIINYDYLRSLLDTSI